MQLSELVHVQLEMTALLDSEDDAPAAAAAALRLHPILDSDAALERNIARCKYQILTRAIPSPRDDTYHLP